MERWHGSQLRMSSNYLDIARRIVKIIVSPDSAIGFMNGILSVPQDLGYLAYGFLDTDSRYIRENERIRMVSAIRYGILQNDNFTKTIERVLGVFNKYVPEAKQNEIYSKTMFSIAGRAATNTIVSKKIAEIVAQRAGFVVGLRGGVIGNLLLAGGMSERSIYTSTRLKVYAPEVYDVLRPNDYDLLYFFVEPAMQPFVEAIHVRWASGQSAFNTIIDAVDDELTKQSQQ